MPCRTGPHRAPRPLSRAWALPCLGLAGCLFGRGAPEPLVAPELITVLSQYAGDPIAGPLPHGTALEFEFPRESTVEVEGRLFVVSGVPEALVRPLNEDVRLIIGENSGDPLGSSSLVAPGARVSVGAAATALAEDIQERGADTAIEVFRLSGLTAPGVTVAMSAVFAKPVELLGFLPSERRMSAHLWREDAQSGDLAVALVIQDVVEFVDDGPGDAVDGAVGDELIVRREPRRETIVLERGLEIDGPPLLLITPARFDPDGKLTTAVVLRARSIGAERLASADFEQELEAMRTSVRESAVEDSERRQQLQLDEQLRRRRMRAITALGDGAARRAALVELAGGVAAPLVSELAVMGSEEILDELCGRLTADFTVLESIAGSAPDIAWRLEREAILLMARATAEAELASEYEGMLLRFAGEAGRYPGTLEDAIVSSRTVADFYTRIVDENLIALEDSRPAARVRAFDWLGTNGIPIPDYDPLARSRERRAALRAWRVQREAEEAAAAADASTEGGGSS
ncbi:MAG: hypothetical protein AAGB93_06700 [Planctomycetota bacterium]